MRHLLRPSGIWALAAGAVAVVAVVLASHSAPSAHTMRANASASNTPVPTAESSAVDAAAPIAAVAPTASAPAREPAPAAKATSASAPATPATDDPTFGPGEAGMVVGIDPETGRIGKPSAALREQLQATLPDPALDRSMEGIEFIHKPDGSIMADLKGRFADYTVIRITPDGRKIETCVQGPQVEEALHRPADDVPAAPAPAYEVR